MLRLEAGTKEGLKHLNKNIFIIFKIRFNASTFLGFLLALISSMQVEINLQIFCIHGKKTWTKIIFYTPKAIIIIRKSKVSQTESKKK